MAQAIHLQVTDTQEYTSGAHNLKLELLQHPIYLQLLQP